MKPPHLVDDDLVVGAAEVAERLVPRPLRLPAGGLLLGEPGDVPARLGVPQVEVVLGPLALPHGVHLPRGQRRPKVGKNESADWDFLSRQSS